MVIVVLPLLDAQHNFSRLHWVGESPERKYQVVLKIHTIKVVKVDLFSILFNKINSKNHTVKRFYNSCTVFIVFIL